MGIDRSNLTDEPGETHIVRHARSAPDEKDTVSEGECKTAPDHDNPAEAPAANKSASDADSGATAETRTRGEVYADTRQCCESGWDRKRVFDAPRDELAHSGRIEQGCLTPALRTLTAISKSTAPPVPGRQRQNAPHRSHARSWQPSIKAQVTRTYATRAGRLKKLKCAGLPISKIPPNLTV